MHRLASRCRFALLLIAGVLSMGQASSRVLPGVEVEDQFDLLQVDRRVLLIDAANQRTREFDLEVGEEVIGLDARGLVAVVRTTARLMGTTTEVQDWKELRYRIRERENPPQEAFLGDRVVVVVLRDRLVALSTTSRNWQEFPLGPREPRGDVSVGTNLAIMVTGRRAIAFGPGISRFVEINLTPNEEIEASRVSENSATVTTSRRILIFRAAAGQWQELRRSARGN